MPAAGHFINSEATYTNINAQGYLFAFRPAGQLSLPLKRTISNSTFGTKYGIHVDYGRQAGVPWTREVFVTDVVFQNWDGGAAATTFLAGNYNNMAGEEYEERDIVHVTNFNGTTLDFQIKRLPAHFPECTGTVSTVHYAANGSNITPVGDAPVCITSAATGRIRGLSRYRIRR
jgi:hypothetical protein